MDNNRADESSNPLRDFTNAVKTIVNVPKSTVSKSTMKKDESRSTDAFDMYVCTVCGRETIVYRGHKREKHEHEK